MGGLFVKTSKNIMYIFFLFCFLCSITEHVHCMKRREESFNLRSLKDPVVTKFPNIKKSKDVFLQIDIQNFCYLNQHFANKKIRFKYIGKKSERLTTTFPQVIRVSFNYIKIFFFIRVIQIFFFIGNFFFLNF